ncbi:MAG: flagellar export protein FliJ [Treponema sp.]
MKAFHFKLEKLLALRAFKEKEAEIALARAVSARDAIILNLQKIAERELTTRKNFESDSYNTLADFTILEHYLIRLYAEKEQQITALAQAELTIEQERAHYIQAHKDRLIMTKLREKKEAQWKADVLKEQDNIIDDMVNTMPYKNYSL